MTGSNYQQPATTPRPNRYQVLQPQFLQPNHPFAARNRYRSSHSAYDAVEDEDLCDGDTMMPFDDFDQRLLAQPYEGRQQAPERSRGRLSLAPGPSRFFGGTTGLDMDRYEIDEVNVRGKRDLEIPQPSVSARLSQFAYNPDQPLEPSSDMQLAPSSSPAFKARQRRAEHNFSNSQRATELQPFDDIPQRTNVQCVSETSPLQIQQEVERPFQKLNPSRPQKRQPDVTAGAPVVQGIRLVPTSSLPDRLRTVFPFPNFNAVQSKCFDNVFRSDDNFVLASPTGSGKTVILELAICRAVNTNATSQYKVIYQAPTKALCSERQRDWEKKFNQIGLTCAELTGDSNAKDLRNVQSANIIITTPEKWDSMTRKWKDHEKLMKLVKLFLIDEVHILKDDRGAALEAVVSRMKSIGNGVRFVALSATVPNFQDVAAWLGKSTAEPHTPAANEKFGEEFRPVQLKRHVCGYAYNSSNEFAFEKFLGSKLPDVIAKYSERKPIMVFCATRNSTVSTAKLLASWWNSASDRGRMWSAPDRTIGASEKGLRELLASGVAFHHAGLGINDRLQVEKGFLDGDINVICCTSTLAVGVNLPCHLVIVKNTMSWAGKRPEEYSDLEMMQMLGRAGRPQFDNSAVAVIMTRQSKSRRYETLVTGQDILESKLHLNLIDHLNAEISLGTIRSLPSAHKWLTGTFLYTRLKQNPRHYKIEGSRSGQSLEEQVDDICFRDIALLREFDLVTEEEQFRCTEYGQAMARYYIPFETMKLFMGLPPKASLSEILSALAQASEFSSIRFRAGEKPLYKALNKSPQIRFPIPVNLDLPAQKVSLLIQSVLGSADIAWNDDIAKFKGQYHSEISTIFKSIGNHIRCIIDCQVVSGDSVSMNAALMLERSLGAKAWDDSPLQMIQVPKIGVVAARKLVNARIRSIEELEAADARRIETFVGRNPPFGLEILDSLKSFPKLRVSLHVQLSSVMKCEDGVKVQLKADIGFMNEKPPDKFAGKFIYVCVLVETSDGRIVHFARISGVKLSTGQSIVFPAKLTSPDQSINCYIMCDSIAGSMRCATVKPKIASSMFVVAKPTERGLSHQSNTSKRRAESLEVQRKQAASYEEFGDDDIDDHELMRASLEHQEFEDIDNFANIVDINSRNNPPKSKSSKEKVRAQPVNATPDDHDEQGPVQLENGKWACNHKCKDKTACKHMCCRDGVDKPPKKATKKTTQDKNASQPLSQVSIQKDKKMQTKLQLSATKRRNSQPVEELDLTQPEKRSKTGPAPANPDLRRLEQLHKNVQKNKSVSSTSSIFHKSSGQTYDQGRHGLSFMPQPAIQRPETPSDYGDIHLEFSPEPTTHHREISYSDDIPGFTTAVDINNSAKTPVSSRQSDMFDDDSLLGDAMIGLADSQQLTSTTDVADNAQFDEEELNAPYDSNMYDDVSDFEMDMDFTDMDNMDDASPSKVDDPIEPAAHAPQAPKRRTNKQQKQGDHKLAPSILNRPQSKNPQKSGLAHKSSNKHHPTNNEPWDMDAEILDVFDLSETDANDAKNNPTAIHAVKRNETTAIAARKEEQVPDTVNLDDDFSDVVRLDDELPDAKMDGEPPTKQEHDVPVTIKKEEMPEAFKDFKPWLFEEFGDIVELEDD